MFLWRSPPLFHLERHRIRVALVLTEGGRKCSDDDADDDFSLLGCLDVGV